MGTITAATDVIEEPSEDPSAPPIVWQLLTVEVDMKRRAVIQARGWRNRPASGKALRLLQDWTVRERVRLEI